jgi:GntR family transcriptional regulator
VSRATELFGAEGLSAEDPTPLYLRLQARIRDAIESGALKPREALPAERDIAAALKVSRVTVRKALVELVEAGLLNQRQGSGTFVAQPPRRIEQALSHLTSFNEDMRLRGLEPTVRWLGRGLSLPSPEEAMRLQLSPRDQVSRLRRLRLAGGVPMAIERACLPVRYLPDPGVVEHSLYAVLEARGLRPVRALQRLSAANLPAEEAALLEIPAGSAALSIERVSFLGNGAPIEFTRSWYRGDLYDFVAELIAPEGGRPG